MLRQDLTSNNPPQNGTADNTFQAFGQPPPVSEAVQRLDIQQSLNVLEELILGSPRVPFSRRTLVDEDQLLEQLDRIRLNLPSVFQEAVQIVQQRERILAEAEQYAHDVINAAEQEAARRLDDLGIVQQAEAQAHQVRQQLQQDCDGLRSHTLAEIEQWQQAAQQHWEQIKLQAEADCQALKQEADAYAAQMLDRLEQQLSEMLRVVHNGRRSLPSASGGSPEDGGRSTETMPTGKTKALPQSEGNRPGRSRRKSG